MNTKKSSMKAHNATVTLSNDVVLRVNRHDAEKIQLALKNMCDNFTHDLWINLWQDIYEQRKAQGGVEAGT